MHILVISDRSMFGEGLCALLSDRSEFQVLRMGVHVERQEVLAQVALHRPDVIILLDCPEEENGLSLAAVRCLKNGWVRKIVTVDRRDNSLCILRCRRCAIEHVQNLVEAIMDDVQDP
ncbi:MAG: response regulator transcription factor [Anaerolineaceae bacterium]|jgi:DNA-binding NarL/FixJ family response regulator|nr:response regulator transcription factor [Anaerolineaceae bacterium]